MVKTKKFEPIDKAKQQEQQQQQEQQEQPEEVDKDYLALLGFAFGSLSHFLKRWNEEVVGLLVIICSVLFFHKSIWLINLCFDVLLFVVENWIIFRDILIYFIVYLGTNAFFQKYMKVSNTVRISLLFYTVLTFGLYCVNIGLSNYNYNYCKDYRNIAEGFQKQFNWRCKLTGDLDRQIQVNLWDLLWLLPKTILSCLTSSWNMMTTSNQSTQTTWANLLKKIGKGFGL